MKTGVGISILLLPVCAYAITFTSNANILPGDSWMNVDIYDTPPNHTTVNMFGGSVLDSMGVRNAATFNMFVGTVGSLGALDQSMVNISGGSVGIFSLSGSATATLSQNGSIFSVGAGYSSIFNMNGGNVTCLGVGDNAIINLSGGVVIDYLSANPAGVINVFGYNLAKTSTGGTHGYGQLTGSWQINSPQFVINLGGPYTYEQINLIPEPTTLLLFGIGTFLLRRRLYK